MKHSFFDTHLFTDKWVVRVFMLKKLYTTPSISNQNINRALSLQSYSSWPP